MTIRRWDLFAGLMIPVSIIVWILLLSGPSDGEEFHFFLVISIVCACGLYGLIHIFRNYQVIDENGLTNVVSGKSSRYAWSDLRVMEFGIPHIGHRQLLFMVKPPDGSMKTIPMIYTRKRRDYVSRYTMILEKSKPIS